MRHLLALLLCGCASQTDQAATTFYVEHSKVGAQDAFLNAQYKCEMMGRKVVVLRTLLKGNSETTEFGCVRK